MTKLSHDIGFTYFTSPKFQINRNVQDWMKALHKVGSSVVIVKSAYDRAVSEEVFRCAMDNNMSPIVHFSSELPLARKFNDVAFLLDVYAKWGVSHVIFGEQPNTKKAWQKAGWHYENIVDHFLDRFIPLANHAVNNGIVPILSPMIPGGDYWDTAFIELVFTGLKRRRLESILDKIMLSSYGFTYNKALSWGKGGPERWAKTKPYLTPEGQEDQIGFHNFEWVQAIGERTIGKKLPVIILDAGHTGPTPTKEGVDPSLEYIKSIYELCYSQSENEGIKKNLFSFDKSICWCTFSLDTIRAAFEAQLSVDTFLQIFTGLNRENSHSKSENNNKKVISHYLLLPSFASGVSDAVLNKVRPLIKKYQPTVGFSLEEAACASKVSVYPEPVLFSDEKISQLRSTGSIVEILPESGIEIATLLHNS